jgi:hypothetical protein
MLKDAKIYKNCEKWQDASLAFDEKFSMVQKRI